jgi:hypothetical protein
MRFVETIAITFYKIRLIYHNRLKYIFTKFQIREKYGYENSNHSTIFRVNEGDLTEFYVVVHFYALTFGTIIFETIIFETIINVSAMRFINI